LTGISVKIFSRLHKEIEGRENSFFVFSSFEIILNNLRGTFGTNVNKKLLLINLSREFCSIHKTLAGGSVT